jgi:hypothetical protein
MSRLLTRQLMATVEVTKNAGHTLEPEGGWPAEGKGVTESPLYTFSGDPSK